MMSEFHHFSISITGFAVTREEEFLGAVSENKSEGILIYVIPEV